MRHAEIIEAIRAARELSERPDEIGDKACDIYHGLRRVVDEIDEIKLGLNRAYIAAEDHTGEVLAVGSAAVALRRIVEDCRAELDAESVEAQTWRGSTARLMPGKAVR